MNHKGKFAATSFMTHDHVSKVIVPIVFIGKGCYRVTFFSVRNLMEAARKVKGAEEFISPNSVKDMVDVG